MRRQPIRRAIVLPDPASGLRRTRGLTLLELVVALVIGSVLLAAGVPNVGAWLSEQALAERADALVHALDVARSEAIKRGSRVDVCPGGSACPGSAMPWEGGWTTVPHGLSGSANGGAFIARERPAPSGVTVRGNRPVADYVSYTGMGLARRIDGALQMGTFTVCSPGHRARKVILASSGRARVEQSTEVCP